MKNKIWMVTGASQGLGLAVTKKLLSKNFKVIATTRNKEKLESLFENNKNLLIVNMNINDQKSITKAIEEGIKKFNSIDILLNNAGYDICEVLKKQVHKKCKII
ncbi:SDR family NAD(P)-dependent oxidoreductase [Spiroplasma floricola]|uniref:SDR family NAD(P)-dependent oxidoreductase n=1 Tax=Spiroplasma floricola TaxID=216937 RepID=UPI002481B9FB|nr:SDR family NAD(P)-dependent oxidoreductase [Spiroplasma floricola]